MFPCESTTYTIETLKRHNKIGDKNDPSFRGHPDCKFCSRRFFSLDELYEHCKQAHEQCFLCQRQSIQNQYFLNYQSLEEHFSSEHFPCNNTTCLEQKFVVFESDMDLKGHDLKNHSDAKSRHRGRPIALDLNYVSSTSARRSEEELFKSREKLEKRIRVPAGFGSQLTASQSSDFNSFAPRALVGRERLDDNFPLPQDSLPSLSNYEEISLTPSQADVLVSGGQQLIVSLQKLIGTSSSAMAKVKIGFWSFKSGATRPETFLKEFFSLAKANNEKKKEDILMIDVATMWRKLSEILPIEISDEQVRRAVDKKSKKKGLSIDEFEALRRAEPRQTAMLRVWNDFKATVKLFVDRSIAKRTICHLRNKEVGPQSRRPNRRKHSFQLQLQLEFLL